MAGLLDYLLQSPVGQTAQAASNAIAQNVSGPVDLLSWALRKAGVPVPEDAVGSSKWMEQLGLTALVENPYARVVGETAGMVGPTLAAAYSPQVANALNNVPALAREYVQTRMGAPGGASPATVWHGSPHKFDKFDSAHIGTGEGAQAYGHGLYLTDERAVGEGYKASTAQAHGKKYVAGQVEQLDLPPFMVRRLNAGGSIDDEIARLRAAVEKSEAAGNKFGADGLRRTIDDLLRIKQGANGAKIEPNAFLYKVDLPDEMIARMLDWDKPLSQQAPEVQDAVRKIAQPKWITGANGERRWFEPLRGNPTGSEILHRLRMLGHGVPEDALKAQNVPGIRYLDGNSRGAGAGSSNYVVFPGEEGLLTILERNGQGLLK